MTADPRFTIPIDTPDDHPAITRLPRLLSQEELDECLGDMKPRVVDPPGWGHPVMVLAIALALVAGAFAGWLLRGAW
jgi:hypothetical protein